MSLPGKIFIFLNLILSVAFAIASLSLFAKKVNFVKEAEINIAKRNDLQKKLDVEKGKNSEISQKLDKTQNNLTAKINSLEGKFNIAESSRITLSRSNTELSSSYSKLESALANLRTDLQRLMSAKEKLENRLAKISEELQKSVDDRNFAQKSALEATADVKELEAQLMAVNKRAAELLEQNLQYKSSMASLQKRFPDAITPTVSLPVPVRGRILRVDKKVDLVIISVGKSDKIKAGMEFIISRGNDYIGKAKVRTLHKNICAAVINKELTIKQINVGDIAETL